MAFRVDKPWGSFVESMFFIYWAGVAQLVEQLICNQQVGGSSPFASSICSGMLEGDLKGVGAPLWAAVLRYCRLVVGDFFLEHPPYIAGRFPSGQREQTVNLSAQPSEVRILPSPFFSFVLGQCGNSSVG